MPFFKGILMLAPALFASACLVLVSLPSLAPTQQSNPRPVPLPASVAGSVPASATPISVVVSIPPLKGIADDLGKDVGVVAQTLIPVGVSEHGYEIPAGRFRELAKADIVLYVGRGLEPAVTKYLSDHPAEPKKPREQIEFASLIDTEPADTGSSKTSSPATPQSPHNHDHSHDHEGHAHGPDCNHDADPHLWLDPANMKRLVPAVRAAIERILKSRGDYSADAKDSLDRAEQSLLTRIDAIDAAYTATLARAENRTIVVAHDAYGLLAHRYNLTTIPIAGLHASEPTSKDIKRAIDTIKSRKASVVYVEPQLSRGAGQRVAKATGAKVLTLDPVGGDNWFATMNKNLDALASGLSVERVPTKD